MVTRICVCAVGRSDTPLWLGRVAYPQIWRRARSAKFEHPQYAHWWGVCLLGSVCWLWEARCDVVLLVGCVCGTWLHSLLRLENYPSHPFDPLFAGSTHEQRLKSPQLQLQVAPDRDGPLSPRGSPRRHHARAESGLAGHSSGASSQPRGGRGSARLQSAPRPGKQLVCAVW